MRSGCDRWTTVGALRHAFALLILSVALILSAHGLAFSDERASPTQEISSWYAIQASRDPADFRAYLQQYPSGTFTELAANHLEILDPDGPSVALVPVLPLSTAVIDRQILALLDFAFWDTMKGSRDPNDLKAYLRKFPQGAFRNRVRHRLHELEPGTWVSPNYPAPD